MKKTILFIAIITQTVIAHSQSKNLQDWLDGINYGDQPAITQLAGYSGGENILELSAESIDTIMAGFPWRDFTPDYKPGYGPISVKVIDPLNLVQGKFYLVFYSVTYFPTGVIKPNDGKSSKWYVYQPGGDTIYADHWINFHNEQLIPEWGISITINWVDFPDPEDLEVENGGVLGSVIEYSDPSKPWLKFFEDTDIAQYVSNWIRCGTQIDENYPRVNDKGDPEEYYENICEGKWSLYKYASHDKYGPCYNNSSWSLQTLAKQRPASIDIIITGDSSKWTRCPVIELCEDDSIDTDGDGEMDDTQPGPSGVWKFDLRNAPSVDKDGNAMNVGADEDTLINENLSNYIGSRGMSWFPGYAIDIETGERLNMAFGENSWYSGQNGNDMMWNPTGELYSELFESSGQTAGYPWLGGMHYIYVFGHNEIESDTAKRMYKYDGGRKLFERFMLNTTTSKRDIYRNAMYVSIPYRDTTFDMFASDVKVKIRMANPYKVSMAGYTYEGMPNGGLPTYEINTMEFSGVEETLFPQRKFMIWPNPAQDLLNVSQESSESCELVIYGITGNVVYKGSFCTQTKTIDVSGFEKGIYLVKITGKNGSRVVKFVHTP